jgi:hypothetical protein
MLSRPTTEQIILDCREELLSTIAPALPEGPVLVALQMMENVLRNCATRAAHEIAWMREEGDEMVEFARRIAADECATTALADALAEYDTSSRDSLHLDDAVADYSRAGTCMSAAIDAVMAAGEVNLQAEAHAILRRRLEHENEIMGEWAFVGRA